MSDEIIEGLDGSLQTVAGGGVTPDGNAGQYSHKQGGNRFPVDILNASGEVVGSAMVVRDPNTGVFTDDDGNTFTANPRGLGVVPTD